MHVDCSIVAMRFLGPVHMKKFISVSERTFPLVYTRDLAMLIKPLTDKQVFFVKFMTSLLCQAYVCMQNNRFRTDFSLTNFNVVVCRHDAYAKCTLHRWPYLSYLREKYFNKYLRYDFHIFRTYSIEFGLCDEQEE